MHLRKGSVTEKLNDGVYRVLKAAILKRRLAPGCKLDEVRLAEELGVSRTPVREAFQRLSSEGLIVLIPHRGAFVTQLTRRDLEELYEMREALEGQAARLAATRVNETRLARLEEIIAAYRTAVSADRRKSIVLLDSRFHEAVARASRNRRLMEAIHSLREQLRILRTTSVAIPGRPGRSLEEMSALMEAIRARDPDLAEERMRIHIRSVRDEVLNSWKEAIRG